MAQTDTDYDSVSYVISSSYREEVMSALQVQADTPSAIEERTNVDVAHVSRALGELREEGLVDLLVSEDRKKGRLYGLTENGAEVAEVVAERE